MSKLLLNSAQCLNCGSLLDSTHVHHFVACTCYTIAQITIFAYTGKKYKKDNTYTKQWAKLLEENNDGIFIDGGLEYQRYGGNLTHFKDLSVYEEDEPKKSRRKVNNESKTSKKVIKNKRGNTR